MPPDREALSDQPACAACGKPVRYTDKDGCVGTGPVYHYRAECLLEASRREHAENERLRERYEPAPMRNASYVCESCGDNWSDMEFKNAQDYEKALREARWDVSTLQTERDAAIASATMPLRIALRAIVNTQPFCPAPSPLLGGTPWEIAKSALASDEQEAR